MSSEADLSHALDLIYGAALDQDMWPAALHAVREFLGCSYASIGVQDFDRDTLMAVRAGISDEAYHQYLEYYGSLNPLWRPTATASVGSVLMDRVVVEDYERTDFFNLWCRPNDLHTAMSIKVIEEERTTGVIAVGRGRSLRGGEFQRSDIERYRLLAPHLHRAIQISQRLDSQGIELSRLADTIERLPQGVILTDSKAHIIFANRMARDILADADGLHSGRGGLYADDPAQTAVLMRLIGEAAMRGTFSPGGALALDRRSQRRALVVLVTRLPPTHGVFGQHHAAVVFVSDPERKPEAPPELLARLYGLTKREAALVALLFQDFDLQEAAERLGMAMNTARTHLRHVLEKTRTHRQAELMGLLLRSVPLMS